MKNTIIAVAVLSLALMAACKKSETSNNTGSAGGTWTFKSITYQAPGCDTSTGAITATVVNGSGADSGAELAVDFYDTVPPGGGTFYVIRGNYTSTKANQVQVGITDENGNFYLSTGNGGPTVSLTVTNGKVNVSGSGIELVNLNNPSDSSTLTFTIHQTD